MTDRSRPAGDTLDLLGLVGFVSLASVGWLGGSLAAAPTLRASIGATRALGQDTGRFDAVVARIVAGEADAEVILGGFDGLLDDFEARTPARSWWEGLVKVYIANGLLRDFCLLAADGLAPDDRGFLVEALATSEAAALMARDVADAATADPVLASRLALWGRRLVGEALGVVQGLSERPGIARLLAAGHEDPDNTWIFSQLTAEHTRRMGRLGLAA